MKIFRPQDISKKYLLRIRRQGCNLENYNWQSSVRWYPIGWSIGQQIIGNQHRRLHYLACHAPAPIKKKWVPVYRRFYQTHFGSRKHASVRYLNNWSCHSWM